MSNSNAQIDDCLQRKTKLEKLLKLMRYEDQPEAFMKTIITLRAVQAEYDTLTSHAKPVNPELTGCLEQKARLTEELSKIDYNKDGKKFKEKAAEFQRVQDRIAILTGDSAGASWTVPPTQAGGSSST